MDLAFRKKEGLELMHNTLFRTEGLIFNNMIEYPDITIEKGTATFIVGESGSGKSTLIKLFNASISACKGKIFYNEELLNNIDTIKLRSEVSVVSQEIFLFDTSIENNFSQFYGYLSLKTPNKVFINKMLEVCCLDFPLDKDCTSMSGGERQRLYMAIFLSFKPKVIILDEPTSGLDGKNTKDVMCNILNFCKENCMEIIIVTHDYSIIEQFGGNIIRLDRSVN